MVDTRVQVWIGGRAPVRVGTLFFRKDAHRERSAFEYDAEWLARPEAFAISPDLPMQSGMQFPDGERGSVFHSAIADSEPDGWGRLVVRNRFREDPELTDFSALTALLMVTDTTRIGALRYRIDDDFLGAVSPGQRGCPPFIDLARVGKVSQRIEAKAETLEDLRFVTGAGTTFDGMRPKCAIADVDETPSLGKFPSTQDTRDVVRGEVLALRLGALAGLSVATARAEVIEGKPVAIIRRFDRAEGGKRLHYLSAASMLGVNPRETDQRCYTDIVDALSQVGERPTEDAGELWSRVALSILITNVDDHMRNHGFLHVQDGRWRLAPAFDINPAPERQQHLKTWISPDTGNACDIRALMHASPQFLLSPDQARERLSRVVEAVGQWKAVARQLGMNGGDLRDFAPAFNEEQRAVATKMCAARPRPRSATPRP